MRNDRTIPRQTRGVAPRLASLYGDLAEARRVRDAAWADTVYARTTAKQAAAHDRYAAALYRIGILKDHILAEESLQ